MGKKELLISAGLVAAAVATAGCASNSAESVSKGTDIPGSTPTPTETPAPTQDYFGDALKGLAATQNAIYATQTAIAQGVPMPDSANSQPTTSPEDSQWLGEFSLNEFRSTYSGSNVFIAMNSRSASGLQDYKNYPTRQNSYLSSLVNPFSTKDFGVDPLTEPGLGQTYDDILTYRNISDFSTGLGLAAVRDLAHLNNNGLRTMGIFGPANDKDAMAAILAVAHLYDADNNPGIEGDMTLDQVFNDPKLEPEVRKQQQEFLNKIREKDLGPSKIEEQRIVNQDPNDVSHLLPKDLRDGDQFSTCEVDRPLADSGLRQDQLQNLHEVPHIDNGSDSFVEADLNNESLLMAWAMDQDGRWGFRAFTDREFKDFNPGSASGDQLLNCGVEVPVEVPTPTVTPTQTVYPTPTGAVITFPTPTKPFFTVTPAPTQPIQPTVDQPGQSTPMVDTPMPTPAPTKKTEPKNRHSGEKPVCAFPPDC